MARLQQSGGRHPKPDPGLDPHPAQRTRQREYGTCRSTTSTSTRAASSCAGRTRASQRVAVMPSPSSAAATTHCGAESAQRGAASAATRSAASRPDAAATTRTVHEAPPLPRNRTRVGGGVVRRRQGQCREALQGIDHAQTSANLLYDLPKRPTSLCSGLAGFRFRLEVDTICVRPGTAQT